MMNDILLHQDIDVYSFWPVQSMIDMMGEDYLTYFNIARIKKNITLKAIWPPAQSVDVKRYPFMSAGKEFLRDMRVAPDDITAKLSYMVYDNKVMVTSSRRESYGFILQSQDMADMMVDQFQMIWKISRPVIHETKGTESFLTLLHESGENYMQDYEE